MAQVNFRIDDETKREADRLFGNLGISLSGAITIFIRQSLAHRGLPFEVREESSRVARPESAGAKSAAARWAALKSLAGSWVDDRSTEEIITDIERHRTKGKGERKRVKVSCENASKCPAMLDGQGEKH